MLTTTLITAEEFLEMSLDTPVELVRGEIVEMTRPDKTHGSVCGRVAHSLYNWSIPGGHGEPSTNDSAILTERDPDTLRGADVAFYAATQLPSGKLEPGHPEQIPALCVEVLSPSNTWREMLQKIDEYLSAGVREVWIVDPHTCTVEVFTPHSAPRHLSETDTLTSDTLPGFSAPIADFFAGIA